MPWSAPPYRPSTGALSSRDQVDRVLGVQLVGLADQPAVPGDAGLEARVVRRVEPDDPAAPAEAGDAELRAVSPLPGFLAQATVASRSDITWASGTLVTTLEMISWKFSSFETSPWRA